MSLKIYSYLLIATLLSFYYFYLYRRKSPPVKWWIGFCTVILVSVSTQVVLETDLYRYTWDGINSSRGINPFKYEPSLHPWFDKITWSKLINHPELRTIYPPGAQFLFLISTYLNPFFYGDFQYLTSLWHVVFGWKLLIGISAAFSIFILRKKRWDLIVANPAFLILSLGNAHLDSLLIPLILIILSVKYSAKNEIYQNIALIFGILTKWVPILFFPALFVYWLKKWGKNVAISASVMALSVIIFCLMIFYKGSDNGLFLSTKVYSDSWYFFGFIHRFMADILSVFYFQDVFGISKLICLILGAIFSIYLFYHFYKNKISYSLFCLWITLGLFIFSPTLHPWYLLILLPLGLSYKNIFITPFVWPILGLFSKIYFIENKDPIVVRYIVYIILTLLILHDFNKVLKRVSFKNDQV